MSSVFDDIYEASTTPGMEAIHGEPVAVVGPENQIDSGDVRRGLGIVQQFDRVYDGSMDERTATVDVPESLGIKRKDKVEVRGVVFSVTDIGRDIGGMVTIQLAAKWRHEVVARGSSYRRDT